MILVPQVCLAECTHQLVDVQFMGNDIKVWMRDLQSGADLFLDHTNVWGGTGYAHSRSYAIAPYAFLDRDGYCGWYPHYLPYGESIDVELPHDMVWEVIDLG